MASKVKGTTGASPPSNSNLPKGWHTVRFGDVVRDVNESERNPLDAGLERYVGLEHIEPENLHLKQWGMLADSETSFRKRFRKGQVLFGKRRAYQRKVAVAEFDGICSSDILTFEPEGDALIPELLPFIVQSDGFFKHALGTSSGSLSPRTRWSQLQDYEFQLPPKDEQRRIAEILWTADELIIAEHNVLESLNLSLQAFLRETFLSPGDGKKEVLLSDICEIQSGFAFKSDDYLTSGIPLVRISNVAEPNVDLSEKTVYLPPRFLNEYAEFVLLKGDLLVALSGATTGKVGVYNLETPALLNQRVGRLRYRNEAPLSSNLFNQIFFLFRERILRDAYGGAQPNISPRDMKNYSIFVPQDITASTRIVNAFVSQRDAATRALNCTKQLVFSLSKELLTGAISQNVQ